MKTRKAQGLSLNVIIIAALALVVLIILVLIFTGQTKIFTSGLASCTNKGGKCANQFNRECPEGYANLAGTDCKPYDCCIPYT